MNKDHHRNPKNAVSRSKPAVKPAHKPNDRPSLAGERAEGEGMIAPAPQHDPSKKGAGSQVEGEGSYSATRRYDEGVQRGVEKGDTERLAREAAEALDGPQGDSLRKAEQAAKQGHTN